MDCAAWWLAAVTATVLCFTWLWQAACRPRFEVADRVAVITGAGSGIGRQLAIDLCAARCAVVLMDLRPELLARVMQELLATNPVHKPLSVVCDVADPTAVAQACSSIQTAVAPRKVSIVINNAGVVMGQSMLDLTPAMVTRSMQVNCLGQFWLIQAFLPDMMTANDGAIVCMSSMMGLLGGAGLADYCATKWAVGGMMEALRLELRRNRCFGVHTLTVCPFAVQTGMFEGIYAQDRPWSLRAILFPLLAPTHVSLATLAALRARRTLVTVPWFLSWAVCVVRLLPVALYDWVLAMMGGCHGMDTFKGRGLDWNFGPSPVTTRANTPPSQ